MRETSVRHLLVTSTFQRAAKRAAKQHPELVSAIKDTLEKHDGHARRGLLSQISPQHHRARARCFLFAQEAAGRTPAAQSSLRRQRLDWRIARPASAASSSARSARSYTLTPPIHPVNPTLRELWITRWMVKGPRLAVVGEHDAEPAATLPHELPQRRQTPPVGLDYEFEFTGLTPVYGNARGLLWKRGLAPSEARCLYPFPTRGRTELGFGRGRPVPIEPALGNRPQPGWRSEVSHERAQGRMPAASVRRDGTGLPRACVDELLFPTARITWRTSR